MARRPTTSISLEEAVLEAVDRTRGEIPRSTWLNQTLKALLLQEEVSNE